MAEPALNAPFFDDADSFLAWAEGQDARHEFVDGRITAMTGGSVRHSGIALNVAVALSRRLAGTPCRPFGSDLAVRTRNEPVRLRFPDVSVVCNARAGRLAVDPVVIVEVLSPSTEAEDRSVKLLEYLALASLRHVVLITQDVARAEVYTPTEDGHRCTVHTGEAATLRLPDLGVELPLSEVYAGLPPAGED